MLRRRNAGESSYRCPGYPFTPAIYLLATLCVAIASFVDDPWRMLKGVMLVASGIPLYLLIRWRRSTRNGGHAAGASERA